MSRVVQFMRDLVAKGMSWDDAAIFAERFEQSLDDAVSSALASAPVIDSIREKKRERDRARYWRNRGEIASETGAENVAEIGREIAAKSATETGEHSARICGEDNLSRLEVTGNNTTPKRERDFRSRADLDWLQVELREAGGPTLANMAIAPGMADLSPIIGLLSKGSGPPCDLEADVLPTIQARCAGRKAGSIKSWAFFRDPIREARDRRLTGAPAMAEVVPIARGQGPPSITERIGSEIAEARRRALEQLSAQNG